MHLILTSCDFGNEKSKECIIAHFKKPIKQCKVLFFPNEKATQETIQSEKYYNWMQTRGFKKENTYKVYKLTDEECIATLISSGSIPENRILHVRFC